MFEAIRNRQQASAVELAEDLQKSVHSLYYHLNLLEKTGLVQVCDYRRAGKRDEAVYEAVSERLVFNKEDTNPAYVESLIKTVRLALRKAEREHEAARRNKVESDRVGVLRLQATLAHDDALSLRRKVKELGNWVRKRDRPSSESGTETVSLTCLVVPLETARES